MSVRSFKVLGLAIAVVSTLATACGGDGAENSKVGGGGDRVVQIRMVDNAFEPNTIEVSSGETVTFKFTNEGSLAHDAFIGDAHEQMEHGESMDSGDSMEGHNMEGGDALLLQPGEEGEITYTFEESGDVLIGCHQPGHYEAGMKSTVTVG